MSDVRQQCFAAVVGVDRFSRKAEGEKMKDLWKLTGADAIDLLVDSVIEENEELTKKQARILVCNALVYNTVVEEVKQKVRYLLDKD